MTRKLRILIFMDEIVIADELRFKLQNCGYHVYPYVSSLERALEVLGKKQIDVLLMDIELAAPNTAAEMQKRFDVPVVYVNAHRDGYPLERVEMNESFGYVLRPEDEPSLHYGVEMAVYKHEIDARQRANEVLFSSTLQAINDGVIVTDKKERISFINHSAEIILGISQIEAESKSLGSILRFDEGGRIKKNDLRRIMEDGSELRFETAEICVPRQKRKVPVEGAISAMKDDKGRVTGLVLNFRDLSRPLQAEKALKEAEDLYRSLFEDSRDAIYITSGDGTFIEGNNSALRLFGYDRESWKRLRLRDLFDETNVWKSWQKQIEKLGGLKNYEARLRTRGGRFLDCLLTSSVRTDREGRRIGYHGIIRDITESKASERSLKESEARYRLLAENVTDVIWMMDLDLRFTYITPSVNNIIGYRPDQILGLSLDALLSESSYSDAMDLYTAELEVERQKDRNTDRSRTIEVVLMHRDGTVVWVEATLNFVRDASGHPVGILGVAHNITKRKRLEADREKIQAQLFHSQKMEAVGVLAGGVAHDFNNLLTVIQGNADLAMMKLDEDHVVYNDLAEIMTAVVRAAELTGQLLLFSSKQPMKFVNLDLNRIVEGMMRMLQRLIGEAISIQSDLEPILWNIRADRGSLEQVIMNLAVNAKDAMDEGGKLLLKTRNASIDAVSVAGLPNAIPGKYVCLSVADTGSGMDPDLVNHIFEPFYSTKGPGKGTGLGLSVAYGIVRQHKGWIHVMSEPDAGSVFEVYLPAYFMPAEEKSEKSEVSGIQRGHGERILLVEDSRPVRELARNALESHGYIIVTAANAEEAGKKFKEEKGRFQLILADVVLPDMNGMKLIETLISERPSIRVLMISGYTAAQAQWTSIQERGYRFLQKPFSLPDLLKTIREILD